MSRIFYREELETLATFWRIHRRDGVTLGFTAHDRDLWFDGVLHRAAPGMIPSAIRRTADLSPDSVDVDGALAHDAISPADLAAGRFDGARIGIGIVDWTSLERAILYRGTIGAISRQDNRFTAELVSAKSALAADPGTYTSPTCRAEFCGPGCALSAQRFTNELQVAAIDFTANRVEFSGGPPPALFANGELRWIDGPQAGIAMQIMVADGTGLAEAAGPATAGDIILTSPGAAQFHLAIAAGPNRFIHAHAGLRRVVATPGHLHGPLLQHWRIAPYH